MHHGMFCWSPLYWVPEMARYVSICVPESILALPLWGTLNIKMSWRNQHQCVGYNRKLTSVSIICCSFPGSWIFKSVCWWSGSVGATTYDLNKSPYIEKQLDIIWTILYVPFAVYSGQGRNDVYPTMIWDWIILIVVVIALVKSLISK